MRIDAHQHYWKISRGDYGWLTPELSLLYRDYQPSDLTDKLCKNNIDGSVVVQAAPTISETEYLLALARHHSSIKGVVGWVDFESQNSPQEIMRLAKSDLFVGLRPMLQDIDNTDWMLSENIAHSFRALLDNDLTFDALVQPRHLKNLKILADNYSAMRIVINHGAKPNIAGGDFQSWANDLAEVANSPNVFCKLSGLATEAGSYSNSECLKPYVDHLLNVFGSDRVVWGSDWPVCNLAITYDEWLNASEAFIDQFSKSVRDAIMGDNARRVYKLRDRHEPK